MDKGFKVLDEVRKSEVISLLSKLVQIPSRNPPGEERDLAEFIVEEVERWGLEAELIPEPFPDRPQAVASISGVEDRPRLVLNGHLDTVPEGEAERWSFNPFGGEIMAGRLYGRGSCDMKAGLASMMIAAKAVLDSGISLRGNLILQFAIGEERGEPGTKTLLMEKGCRGDWGIVLEPTGLEVLTAGKGLLWLSVEITGKPAHASTPELGVNPIEGAARFITRLEGYRRRIGEKRHLLLGKAVCTATMIEAGIKENVVPGSCRIVLDRRLLPGENLDEVEEEIRNILLEMKGEDKEFDGKVTRREEGFAAAEIPSNSFIARVVRQKVNKITGKSLEPRGAAYGTDARNFINDAGIPAVIFGPGDPAYAHTYDESVEISQVLDCSKILALTIVELLA